MQLYTVTMKRKIMSSVFEGKKKVRDEIRFIEEVYTDLPARTAQTYREKFPDAFVSVVPQSQDYGDSRRSQISVDNRKVEKRTRTVQEDKSARATAAEPKTRKDDGYSEVINKMMGASK